jgi:hypothetical protein
MNSFTHTGFIQVAHRFGESSIEPNYNTKEIKSLIDLTNTTAILCFLEMSSLGKEFDEEKLIKEIQEKYALQLRV